jgi:hypothetical protein
MFVHAEIHGEFFTATTLAIEPCSLRSDSPPSKSPGPPLVCHPHLTGLVRYALKKADRLL